MVFPSCKWAERDDKVILTVDVRNVPKDAKIALKDNVVSVEYGEIKAEIKLFKDVITEESSWAVTPRGIVFQLKKKEKGYWNRLIEGKAPAWIKVDWDLWRDEDESEDEEKDDPMAGMDFSNMDFSRFVSFLFRSVKFACFPTILLISLFWLVLFPFLFHHQYSLITFPFLHSKTFFCHSLLHCLNNV